MVNSYKIYYIIDVICQFFRRRGFFINKGRPGIHADDASRRSNDSNLLILQIALGRAKSICIGMRCQQGLCRRLGYAVKGLFTGMRHIDNHTEYFH